jgi:hypothetical protein
MRISRVLDLCTHLRSTSDDLSLENSSSTMRVLLLLVKNGLDLLTPHGTIQGMKELDSPVMVIIREHGHISPHVVRNHREPLKHSINRLTGEMHEILVLSPVGRRESSLYLSVPGMSILQLLPNHARQVLCLTRSNSD